jgi:hypothetical protein
MEAGSAPAASIPAGWYTNPEGPGERYWTGGEWGEVRPESVAASRAASGAADRSQVWWGAVIAAAAMIIGGFGPWATALGLVSVNGTHGDGWFVIIAGCAGLAGLWLATQPGRGAGPLMGAALAGAVGAAVAIYDYVRLESLETKFFGEQVDVVDPAWGIYLAILGGIALAVTAIATHRARG